VVGANSNQIVPPVRMSRYSGGARPRGFVGSLLDVLEKPIGS
jgi:hypothetical protein